MKRPFFPPDYINTLNNLWEAEILYFFQICAPLSTRQTLFGAIICSDLLLAHRWRISTNTHCSLCGALSVVTESLSAPVCLRIFWRARSQRATFYHELDTTIRNMEGSTVTQWLAPLPQRTSNLTAQSLHVVSALPGTLVSSCLRGIGGLAVLNCS